MGMKSQTRSRLYFSADDGGVINSRLGIVIIDVCRNVLRGWRGLTYL